MSWVRVLSCIFLTIISCFFWGGMKGQANMSFLMFLLHWPKDTNMKPQRNVTPPPGKKRQEWFLIWTSHPFVRVPTSLNRNFQVFFCRFSTIYISPKRVTTRGFPPLVVDWLKDPHFIHRYKVSVTFKNLLGVPIRKSGGRPPSVEFSSAVCGLKWWGWEGMRWSRFESWIFQ